MKKSLRTATSLSLLLALILLNLVLYRGILPVYKDRLRWESTGKIIWRVPVDQKLIALTFDDGPSPTFTPQVLDVLNQFGVKATFFVVGRQVEKFPAILVREAREGHTVGNHMYTHSRVDKLSLEALIDDLRRADQLIYNLSGTRPHFFRPPDGYYDEKIVAAAEALNYQVVIWTWSQDTRDWSNISARTISERVLQNARPGDIILMHDQGGDRSNTLEALKLILPGLLEKGYKPVTLDELVESRAKKPGNSVQDQLHAQARRRAGGT
ncbi:MAG: polysaccharide deacetylase family protein [Peptococcaceae bacterium]|nr:polysaccharide deacetylase family protein [Peptococcaceae bacterium]MDH7525059.1 polysaccharide deacetylase family protein [Peptococcaceae bacterium]